jgi:hypothetical protein
MSRESRYVGEQRCEIAVVANNDKAGVAVGRIAHGFGISLAIGVMTGPGPREDRPVRITLKTFAHGSRFPFQSARRMKVACRMERV